MKINVDFKTILIVIAIAWIVLFQFKGCETLFSPTETVKETVTETVDTTVTENTEVVTNNEPKKHKPTKQRVKVEDDKITKVDSDYTPTPAEKADSTYTLDLNKYNEMTILPNGVLHSEILTSGTLYGTKFKLTTTDTTYTKSKHTERVIVQSGFFVTGGSTIGIDSRIKNIQAGIMYVHKNRWSVGTMLSYDTDPYLLLAPPHRIGVTVVVGFRL